MQNTIKRSDKIIYYKPTKEEEETGGGDLQQFLSFLLVFAGIMMRYKIFIWISLFLMISSFAVMKHRSDYKQFIITTGMCVMGMVSLYAIEHPTNKA